MFCRWFLPSWTQYYWIVRHYLKPSDRV